jgi:Pup amidohydrolase
MAIPKVCGIETEYGIVVRGGDSNPVSASSMLINAYVNATSRKVGWDFEDETPANDARGFNLDDVFAPEIETSLVNAVLPNGARYYVDHAHPEISNPRDHDRGRGRPGTCGRRDRAGVDGYARDVLHDGAEVVIYKNNSDGKGNSLRLPRELPR